MVEEAVVLALKQRSKKRRITCSIISKKQFYYYPKFTNCSHPVLHPCCCYRAQDIMHCHVKKLFSAFELRLNDWFGESIVSSDFKWWLLECLVKSKLQNLETCDSWFVSNARIELSTADRQVLRLVAQSFCNTMDERLRRKLEVRTLLLCLRSNHGVFKPGVFYQDLRYLICSYLVPICID